MKGTVGILNVGAGDTKLVFDKDDPAECIRAARIVKDMLRRGYALLVDTGGGKYQRVHEFRDDTCEYIIADFDPAVAREEERHDEAQPSSAAGAEAPSTPTGGRGRKRAIHAAGASAIAVGRTAGG